MRYIWKKIISISIVFAFVLCVVLHSFAEEKEFFTGTIEDITVEDKIFVVILHEYSGLDKEFSLEDFPGVEIEGVEYITSLKNPNKDYPYINTDEYCQILVLTLSEPGKENVLNAIRTLENNPIIKSALPYPSETGSVGGEINLVGDVNLDFVCNAEDALMILKSSARIVEMNKEQLLCADVNCDQFIDAKDALLVLKIAANII